MAEEKTTATEEVKETPEVEEVTEEVTEPTEETATTSEAEENVETETAEETAETEDAEEASDAEEKPKKGFFKKKTDPKDEKITALQDQVLRQMAEFENFRNRTNKEKEQSFANGAKSVVEKILPIIDNFERAIAARSEETDAGYADGVEMIYKQFNTVLEGLGVKAIEAVGQEFNPDLHNAVMHIDDDQFGENEVVEEFQKGYLYGDTVIRHSMVKVAN